MIHVKKPIVVGSHLCNSIFSIYNINIKRFWIKILKRFYNKRLISRTISICRAKSTKQMYVKYICPSFIIKMQIIAYLRPTAAQCDWTHSGTWPIACDPWAIAPGNRRCSASSAVDYCYRSGSLCVCVRFVYGCGVRNSNFVESADLNIRANVFSFCCAEHNMFDLAQVFEM